MIFREFQYIDWKGVMNQKYLFLGLFFACIGHMSSFQGHSMRHMSMMVDEEFIDGTEFSRTVKSDQGKVEEKFLIDGASVLKDEYYTRLEQAQVKQLRKDRERVDRRTRARIAFADQSHALVLEKLAIKLLQDISLQVERLQHDNLKQYYVFKDDTIQSLSELLEMKHTAHKLLQSELRELVEEHDLLALQDLVKKVDAWPDRLENCFKDTLNHAIKQSDDTAELKELLLMVSGE